MGRCRQKDPTFSLNDTHDKGDPRNPWVVGVRRRAKAVCETQGPAKSENCKAMAKDMITLKARRDLKRTSVTYNPKKELKF